MTPYFVKRVFSCNARKINYLKLDKSETKICVKIRDWQVLNEQNECIYIILYHLSRSHHICS